MQKSNEVLMLGQIDELKKQNKSLQKENQILREINQENDDLRNKLQAKEQLSVKQSHELIRLRKELQENKQKNVILLQENEELKNATVTLAEGLNFQQERADKLEQECEKLKTMVVEAEEAPICFHCNEEPCIRQERDKYRKLSVVFKDVNKQLGYKYITLKQALDKIERVWETDQDGDYDFMKFKILNIINKTKENN